MISRSTTAAQNVGLMRARASWYRLFFLVEDIVERRLSGVGEHVDLASGIFLLVLDANLAVAMAEEPAPRSCGSSCDAEDPGFQVL